MGHERILELLAKQMGRVISPAEVRELKELLAAHPKYHFFNEMVQALKGEPLHKQPDIGEDELVQESWIMLKHELDDVRDSGNAEQRVLPAPTYRTVRRRWLHVAAVLSGLVLLSGVTFYRRQGQKKNASARTATIEQQKVVPYGAPRRMTLPDSSVVWLNAGSQIRYADNFMQDKREIYMEGEAYFEVKHDAGHPFLVHAGNIVIKVLGTAFNVQAYQDENHIETTLINGKIEVQIAGKPDKKIVLTPHEKLTVINQPSSLSGKAMVKPRELSFQVKEVVPLQTATPIPEVAWLQDKLAFQNESFAKLSKRLQRRYNVHFFFKDTLLKKEKLNGVFENESIGKALKLLQMTTPFHYRMEGDTIYLMP